ncbi:MAG: TonB family protein [Candidatus Aminicenantales bacterium]
MIREGVYAIFEFVSESAGERRKRLAVPLLVSAVLHGLVLYAAFTSRWHYKIFTYQERPREAFLAPRELARFPFVKGEPVRPPARPGEKAATRPVSAAPEGGAAATGRTTPKRVEPAEQTGPGPMAAPGPSAGLPGPYTDFKLTYPSDARLSLSKSAGKIEDRYLPPPSHYRTRTDIDFSKYARQGALLSSASSGGPGEGPGGAGSGRPGQAGQRARRPSPGGSVGLNVPGVDFSAWGEIVLNKIQRNWALDAGLGTAWKGEVGLSVLVGRNGDLLAVEIDVPTKIEFLDQAVLRAVRSSGPFPPLPAKYLNSSLEVYLVFKYGD